MAWRSGYELPKEVYMHTLWFIRDYPRMKEEYMDIIGKAHPMDGQPRGTGVGDPTGQMAVKAAELSDRIGAIEAALGEIPQEYRQGVFDNILYRIPYSDYASRNTWKTWRHRFVFAVAKMMNFY